MVEFSGSKAALTSQQIAAAQRQLGMNFPEEYSDFLAAQNGGQPRPNHFAIPKLNDESSVHWFFSIHDGEHNNLAKWIASMRGRIPDELIPIAIDPGGNLICLGIVGVRTGQVFYWDHEREGEKASYRNVYPLASSLRGFLDALQ
jgi:hypothetical protein